MSRIAFLGLGAMGRRMAARLMAAGHEVSLWNRSPAAAEALRGMASRVATSPRDAVRGAEIAIAMVYDDEASRRTWLAPDGAAAGLERGAIAIESGTITPGCVAALRAALESRGVGLLDAPVVGTRPQAEAGQLVHLVGGDASTLDRVRPVLAGLGSAQHHVGPSGSGAWLKLAVNALFGTQVASLAEQLALLRRAGLDLEGAFAALRSLPVTSAAATAAGTLMLARNFAPQAPVALIEKDLGYALAAASELRLELPLTASVRERFAAARDAGFGGENLGAVARLYD